MHNLSLVTSNVSLLVTSVFGVLSVDQADDAVSEYYSPPMARSAATAPDSLELEEGAHGNRSEGDARDKRVLIQLLDSHSGSEEREWAFKVGGSKNMSKMFVGCKF